MKSIQTYLVIICTMVLFSSCQKTKPGEGNDEELITTVILQFTPTGSPAFNFAYRDLDGAGGMPASIDTVRLQPNTTYQVKLQLLNEQETPAQDITTEIEGESAAHRFYFTASATISISDLNVDELGLPLGLQSTWATTIAAEGAATVTLRHYGGSPPDKLATDLVTSPKSATDVSVVFPMKVQ